MRTTRLLCLKVCLRRLPTSAPVHVRIQCCETACAAIKLDMKIFRCKLDYKVTWEEEMKTKIAVAVALVSVLSLTSRAMAQNDRPWIVGQVVPLTGPVATVGARVDQSTQMWVEQVNAAGGIRGRKVQLINCN